MTENISNLIAAAAAIFGAIAAAFIGGLTVWAFRDIRSRSRDILVQILATVMVAVMRRIATGRLISAIQHSSHIIAVPPDMLGSGDHYALEVRGDSMIEAGIFDGDTVLIRKQDTAGTGEIIVALVDDEEATLKRLRRRGNSVALEAANPAYETRIFPPDRVKVQGRLVGLLRKY